MAFEGRSTKTGRKPSWLQEASDIRFVHISGNRDTVLHFEAPLLGDTVRSLYQQEGLWPSKPSRDDTGFDLLADVIADVAKSDRDSLRYDLSLLQRLAGLGQMLDNAFHEVALMGHRYRHTPATLDGATLAAARRLVAETPDPQRARIVGTLNMIQESTQVFAMDLDSGERVPGVLTEGHLTEVEMLRGQRVLALGSVVYRPSGRLLRIDAERIAPDEGEARLWSRIPAPRRRKLETREVRQPQTRETGAAAIFGKWPGDETKEEILEALEKLS